jgi:hypothetical protein
MIEQIKQDKKKAEGCGSKTSQQQRDTTLKGMRLYFSSHKTNLCSGRRRCVKFISFNTTLSVLSSIVHIRTHTHTLKRISAGGGKKREVLLGGAWSSPCSLKKKKEKVVKSSPYTRAADPKGRTRRGAKKKKGYVLY